MDGNPARDYRWAACGKCHVHLHQHSTHRAQDCPDCGTSDQGWRDSQGRWWDPALAQVSNAPSEWISGQFDGNYDGVLLAGHADDALSLRSYTFEVREAVLTDIQPVPAPPLPIDSASLAPLRLPIVRGVHICYQTADMQPRSVLVDLYDLRLHTWGNASTEQTANGAPVMAGRFWGTAYARLGAPPENDAPAATARYHVDDAPADPFVAGARHDWSDPSVSKQAQDTEGPSAGGTATRAPASPTDSPDPVSPETSTSVFAHSAAPVAQSPASTQLAPPENRHHEGPAMMPSPEPSTGSPASSSPPPTIQDSSAQADSRSRQTLEKDSRTKQQTMANTAPEASTDVSAGGNKAGMISNFSRSMRGLWGRERFFRPGWGPILAFLGFLLWLICGWQAMLLGLGTLLLYRLFRLSMFKHRGWPGPKWRAWLHPAPLILLALCAFFAIMGAGGAARCTAPSMIWMTILGITLLLSALARARAAAVVLALLWIGGVLGTFRSHGASCGQTLSQSVRSSVENTTAQIKRQANELVSYDRDAEIVSSDAPKIHGQHRISLNQALDDPSHYFSCVGRRRDADESPVEIYLGESALFGFNSDHLNAEAEANLQKLATLIAYNPAASIVLTGHTDKLGTPLHNLKLSEQRARRIAEWLVARNVLHADRIDVRGAGDRDPVVDDTALYRMNRRVEMHIDCPDTDAPAEDGNQPPAAPVSPERAI
jgi:outer membrane protein OmpA-like peptidoglycan-associated protein